MKQLATKSPITTKVDWTTGSEIHTVASQTGLTKFSGLFEHRSQDRISQRELGLVALSIRLPGKQDWLTVRLWDFTSISFGIVFEKKVESVNWGKESSSSANSTVQKIPLQLGDEIELRIQVTHHQEFQIWCQVKNMIPWKDSLKIGLRRLDVSFPQAVDVNRREAFRLPLAPALALNVRIKHPFIYGYWCPLQVSDVNGNMGLSLLSTDASILLFEGMELQLHFELAGHRETPMIARVAWVHATEANQVKFGVVCLDMDWKLHNGICAYLLFSGHWTPSRLREAGFKSQQVKSRLRFRTVKNMDDYAEVLYLRRDAYVGAGKKPDGTTPEAMAGRLDGLSRILMAHHHDTLVGSMTFTYPNSEDTILDSQMGFPNQKYPVAIPPKSNLIEVSRLCIHQEYRSTDLLQGLFEHGMKHFLMSDRHWLLTSAVADLLPTYLRIGFKKMGASYKHPALNNQEHHLIIAPREAFLWGKGMNLLVWNTLFGDVIQYLLNRNLVDVTGPERALIRTQLLFRPLSRRFFENRANQAFRRHLQAIRQTTSN
jgi:predicted GNAT family N-acyltransferase